MLRGRRILIFTGGNIGEWALEEIQKEDFIIGVDYGALFLLKHSIIPDYAIGDFDSVTEKEFLEIKEKSKELHDCDPVAKDHTDTELAFNWALQRKPKEIVLLGALGTRFDHSQANLHLLFKGMMNEIQCKILDEKNEIQLIDKSILISQGRFNYISILPFSPEVKGITLEGFKYPLVNANLYIGESLGISNVLQNKTGRVQIKSGYLLVVKSMD